MTPAMRSIRDQPAAVRYLLAIGVTMAALFLRDLLNPLLGHIYPHNTIWIALMWASWYCGVGPAIMSSLIAFVGIGFRLSPPYRTFVWTDRNEVFGVIAYVVLSALIIALGEDNRRTLRKRKQAEDALNEARQKLEDRVSERTIELNQATDSLRELSGTLLQLQDDERRRIARELHDSVGQLLAAVSMNMGMLESQDLGPEASKLVREASGLLADINRETRTISHLLHPPLLDEAGLASALRWFVAGFSERSKIEVNVDIATDLGRLSKDMEIAIFRIVQECMTNIHRHSGSATADLVVMQQAGRIRVQIKDRGKGIPPEKQLELGSGQHGVGFRGMRERLRQLGGTLEIQSGSQGTVVTASLPLVQSAGQFSSQHAS
jgi:signal transduction histidine kinase